MKNINLYLTDYKKEKIKNIMYYHLYFMDYKTGLIYKTSIAEWELIKRIDTIDNADPIVLNKLKKELEEAKKEYTNL